MESDQIVGRLRNKGIDVEYMVFDDEGHGFTKYSNLIKALKKSVESLSYNAIESSLFIIMEERKTSDDNVKIY